VTEEQLLARRAKLRNFMRGLRHRRLKLVRIPLGIVLIAFGVLGFLPVLGFWMLPLGIVVLAVDVPCVRHWFRGVRRRYRAWRASDGE
jgi:Flp pilus assembly protein TadB